MNPVIYGSIQVRKYWEHGKNVWQTNKISSIQPPAVKLNEINWHTFIECFGIYYYVCPLFQVLRFFLIQLEQKHMFPV